MLIHIKSLMNCKVQNTDGNLSKIKDIYFDDKTWEIRNLVLDVSKWWTGKGRFLIKPKNIEGLDSTNSIIFISLSLGQVQENSSGRLDAEVQHKQKLEKKEAESSEEKVTKLRSSKELFDFRVQRNGTEIGALKDLTVDVGSWKFEHLVISEGEFSRAYGEMIPTCSVKKIDLKREVITVELDLDNIHPEEEIDHSAQLRHER